MANLRELLRAQYNSLYRHLALKVVVSVEKTESLCFLLIGDFFDLIFFKVRLLFDNHYLAGE